jgi:hypothetical protein
MDEESHGRTKRQPDKVHDGPCAKEFAAVENCAKAKGVTKHRVRQRRRKSVHDSLPVEPTDLHIAVLYCIDKVTNMSSGNGSIDQVYK